MPSPFSHFFRKNVGDFSAEPAGNEDLECGHGSSVLQTPTASGYHSSPSRAYLPESQSFLASTEPQTPIPSRECFSHVQYIGQHGSAVQGPLTSSGPSRVIGYLPRIMYNGSSPLVGPTTMLMTPSSPPNNAINRAGMGNSGSQRRSTSTSCSISLRSLSPRPRFDPDKYGQALRRLETHGCLKTVPSSKQEGDVVDRPPVSLTEFCRALPVEDHIAGLRDSLHQQLRSQNSADPYGIANQESGDDLSSPSIKYTPNSAYQLVAFNREDVFNRAIVPKFEGGQIHRDASPIFEEIDEYLWSPAPSDDGRVAPLAPHMPVPRYAISDVSRASPTTEPTSDSQRGLSRSIYYGDEHNHSLSGSSGNPGVINSPLPHVDVLIPAGNIDLKSHTDLLSSSWHASLMGSRESSSVLFRYSGIITDGASSRPMSEIELKEEVRHLLGDLGKTGLNILSSRDSSSQADLNASPENFRGEHEVNARPEAFPLDQVQNTPADAGPGSGQTSSLSTDCYGRNLSDLKAWAGSSSSETRCPTPPLLFGKRAIGKPEGSNTMSRPALGGTIGRFGQDLRATRLKDIRRLPSTLCSLGEQDWETISVGTEVHPHTFGGIAIDSTVGSSLADNSDSGSFSLSKETPSPFRGARACPVLQHPAYPRHNHSFILLKNSQTGDLDQVPQYEYTSGSYLPNNNARSQIVSSVQVDNTYQHPSPLLVEHNHPFTSSPPIIRSLQPSAISVEYNCVAARRDHPNSQSSLGLSERVQVGKEKQTLNPLYKTTQETLRAPDSAVNHNQKEHSRQSSAWLSTVSEVTSSEPSVAGNGGPLTKVIVCAGKGHMIGTPGHRGNREVGSNLSDASSPGPGTNFSSSPTPVANSLIQFSDTLPSSRQSLQQQAVQKDLDLGNQTLLANFHDSLARSFNRGDSAFSTPNTSNHSRSYSACGPLTKRCKSSLHRRRSSTESHSKFMDSLSAQTAPTLNLSSSDGHAQQTTSSGLLLRNWSLHSDEIKSQHISSQQVVMERRSQQPKADDVLTDDPTTPSSTDSRPFVRNGIAHANVAPSILHHPGYGRDRSWGRIMTSPLRPNPHPNPLGRPLFQRPVARAESPHLHRITHAPTPELLERHVLLSRIYLISSTVIPPIALIYGHGYMDGIMRLHTAGEINGFRNTEKSIALWWGYGMSAICIFAIVIAIIIIPASA